MRKKASARVEVAGYIDKLQIGEVKVEEVNLAEDPKGPKDGWGGALPAVVGAALR
jgi:hypothetical protein